MVIEIDYIMSLIDWNRPKEEQEYGIALGGKIENFNVFLQPCNKNYNKNVWDNCAIIVSMRTDDELRPYLVELLEWLQDLNWPGAFCILERLQKYADTASFTIALNTCLKCAQALGDTVWESNICSLGNTGQHTD